MINVSHHLLFMAFRYALGRWTFAPSIVAEEVGNNMTEIPTQILEMMADQIMSAWAVGGLGDECDVRTWTDLHDLIEAELERRKHDQAR